MTADEDLPSMILTKIGDDDELRLVPMDVFVACHMACAKRARALGLVGRALDEEIHRFLPHVIAATLEPDGSTLH